jgi:hypothetical protein
MMTLGGEWDGLEWLICFDGINEALTIANGQERRQILAVRASCPPEQRVDRAW